MSQTNLITPELIQTFDRVGAVAVRNLLTLESLEALRSGLEPILQAADDYSDYYDKGELATTSPLTKRRTQKSGQTLTRQNAWVISAELRRFLYESPLAFAAAQLLRSVQVRLYEDLMIFKAAATEQPTPWHQDDPQWPVSGTQMCSGWFCLDPADGKTGALRFVSGSHKGPRYRPYVAPSRVAELEADSRYFEGGPLPNVDAHPETFQVVYYDTQPGDVVFFHPRLLHGAFGSHPGHPRQTFSVRFLGDDVRWEPKKSVMYDWLARVKLNLGDPVADRQFPVLWPSTQPLSVPASFETLPA